MNTLTDLTPCTVRVAKAETVTDTTVWGRVEAFQVEVGDRVKAHVEYADGTWQDYTGFVQSNVVTNKQTRTRHIIADRFASTSGPHVTWYVAQI